MVGTSRMIEVLDILINLKRTLLVVVLDFRERNVLNLVLVYFFGY